MVKLQPFFSKVVTRNGPAQLRNRGQLIIFPQFSPGVNSIHYTWQTFESASHYTIAAPRCCTASAHLSVLSPSQRLMSVRLRGCFFDWFVPRFTCHGCRNLGLGLQEVKVAPVCIATTKVFVFVKKQAYFMYASADFFACCNAGVLHLFITCCDIVYSEHISGTLIVYLFW